MTAIASDAVGDARHSHDIDATLRERFGLSAFRSGQRAVIESVLSGRDVLCVMPTGGGKSLCYQLPALLLSGPTLVVSPLIALMKDQVDVLTARGIRATLLNSTLDPAEQNARLMEIQAGRYDLIYVAPERFRSPRFVEIMGRIRPALLAIDEAHCISEWGHDFRPDYARLGQARRSLGFPPCIALTATATDIVRRDIADNLDLQDPHHLVTGFDRPNLTYEVTEARRDAEKLAAVGRILARCPGASVVYASSRARCETIAQYLEHELRRRVVVYHAGLPREDRAASQDRFMNGEAEIVVATNAFGMGVDKPDIRSVIHFNMPGTLEAYYQEAGRAGRDGEPASCILLYAAADRILQERFIDSEYPPRDVVYRIYDFLRLQDADPIELTQAEIKESLALNLNESAIGAAIKILESAGAVERFHPRENQAIVRLNLDPDEPSLVDRLGPQAHVQRLVLTALEGITNRRLREPVYFNPDELATALGLDRTSLTRAIRALMADLPIDYVPPFRGNAIRVIDRDRRPRELSIDFASLDKRKKKEYEKLDQMIRYAETGGCRRAEILGYFGDPDASACGQCDNCIRGDRQIETSGKPARPIDTPAGREVLLKALSGVARARGGFGKTAVALMLAGSSSEKVSKSMLSRLSTFGILNAFKQSELTRLLDALTVARLIESEDVDRFRPVLKLTDKGREYLKDTTATVSLSLSDDLYAKIRNGGLERLSGRATEPSHATSKVAVPAEEGSGEPPEDLSRDPLWEVLRSVRLKWAREQKNPPYVIFSNAALEELVRRKPKTAQELLEIKNFGPSRMERYGAAILQAIADGRTPEVASGETSDPRDPTPTPPRAATRAQVATPRPPMIENPIPPPRVSTVAAEARPRAAASPASSYISTEEWTWRLFDRGFQLLEIAAIRGLEPSAIVRHATWMVRQGKGISRDAVVDPELKARWEPALRVDLSAPPPEAPEPIAGLWSLFVALNA